MLAVSMSLSSDSLEQQERPADKRRAALQPIAYQKHDWSKDHSDNFPNEESPSHRRSIETSCVSMSSDMSKEHPVCFQNEDMLTWSRHPRPSCVSMTSDMSKEHPVSFQIKDSITWSRPPELCACGSLDIQRSIEQPVSMQNEASFTLLREKCGRTNGIFKAIEHEVISLMKEELTSIWKLLSPSYPACPEGEVEGKEVQNSIQEEVQKITLHVLRNMKLHDLAVTLQNKLISVCHKKFKSTLRRKFQHINEGLSKPGNSKLLSEIFTELYITESDSGEINSEHEVRQIEVKAVRPGNEDIQIKCSDLFKPSPEPNSPIRTVLTKGVAGIGKTISVQKFIMDWAEGNENDDIHFIFPLPFRELNLMKEKKLSLMDLLHNLFPETSDLHDYEAYKVLFIFDGLDETRLPLDFQSNGILRDGTKAASVDVLLTNLIKGNLLPSAHIWITSRPAAAHQIPPDCVHRVTEVRGFSDAQKEEYFRRRIRAPGLANRIITHLRSTRSLYIMCHIPVFCWITASVLERMLIESESQEIPKTLTQMFIYFLIFHIKYQGQKYSQDSEMGLQQTRDRILALGKLAFQQLKQGNLIFYEEDLMDCGIDVREVSVYSAMCTEIFREESGLYLGQVYCFVHLSVQEFLAALYVFITFISSNTKHSDVAKNMAMADLLKKAVDKALYSGNGHLDLFLRFLLGISLYSNQTLLRGLITPLESSQSKEETVKYIKEKIRKNSSAEKSINLFHCLNELNDQSLVQEVQTYLNRKSLKRLSGVRFSPAQWSALVFLLLNSEDKLEKFNLNDYDRSEECFLRLLPVIQASRKAVLCWCRLTLTSCKELAAALSSSSSNLRALDLSNNQFNDAGVSVLCKALKSSNCKLESLRLCGCNLTEKSCGLLASIFLSSCLKKLNLSNNILRDSGIRMLCGALDDPNCKLESLKLSCCNLTELSCTFLASVFSSNHSRLRVLNLSNNELRDSGVKMLSNVFKITNCKLEVLKLRTCHLTEKSCSALSSIFTSNSSSIQVLDLSSNNLQDSVVTMVTAAEMSKQCKLETLRLRGCGLTQKSCLALAILLSSKLTEVDLGQNDLCDSGVKLLAEGLMNFSCELKTLKLNNCGITESGCAALSSALSLNPLHLRELDLSSNNIGDLGVNKLSDYLQDQQCILGKLGLSDCGITGTGCAALVSALMSNPSHLRELNLGGNILTNSGLNLLFALVQDPFCGLEKLDTGIQYTRSAEDLPLKR